MNLEGRARSTPNKVTHKVIEIRKKDILIKKYDFSTVQYEETRLLETLITPSKRT